MTKIREPTNPNSPITPLKKLIRHVQCRIKLLKNKRCSIVRQLRDDVAQLLTHGHEQSAFDRVDQLFMDESIVAVYDLLDHFCEFIIIHLSYIRKHKDCPNDINEAVSTLIFRIGKVWRSPRASPDSEALRRPLRT
ncbi:Ist1p [Actinidia rufa]|uniref:Ist1p n=1 Tax=Actinidia rufa TaxID=165716 RepID=A0A7J0G4G9_9ERIC|nr:Ist1p [Actinidia rufa]